ncbi:MAG: STAS domain-containing protein [Chitinivibrionales bacterium]
MGIVHLYGGRAATTGRFGHGIISERWRAKKMSEEIVTTSRRIDEEGIAIVYVNGTIITNIGATDAGDVIAECIDTLAPPFIILNLSHVNYLDSYSFGWLSKVKNMVSKKRGRFVVCCLNDDIQTIFELTNFQKAVPMYETEKMARDALVEELNSH